jgi:hypothetical protein
MKFTPIFVAILPVLTVFASQAATYQVVELGPISTHKSTFSQAINNNNQSIGNASDLYNYPVDLDDIDFNSTTITSNLTPVEIEEVKKGNVSARSLSVLLQYLSAGSSTYTVQRYARTFPLRLDTKQMVRIRETADVQTNNEYLVGINDLNYLTGHATTPFTQQKFTPAATSAEPNPLEQTLWVPNQAHLSAYVITDKGKFKLEPTYVENGGGFAISRGLNNTGTIIGFGSTNMQESVATLIETNCIGATEPENLCYYRSSLNSAYESNGLVWQLDSLGKPGSAKVLNVFGDRYSGLPHKLKEYSEVSYSSTPNDLNDQGLIVGVSIMSDSADIRYSGLTGRDEVYSASHAAIFDGEEVINFIDDKEWLSSSASSVNNKGIVTGYANKIITSAIRSRFFVYDYNTGKLDFPVALFESATTNPKKINDNNKVVGTTEIFTPGTSARSNVGFIYDIPTATFKDLNSMLQCNSAYNIVSADDINEKNVILATAVKQVEKRDVKGELMLDTAGNVIKEPVAIAVQLNPIANGTIDNCSTELNQGYERQGGAFQFAWLSLLLALGLLRRQK